MKMPPRQMAYDADDDPNGPALDCKDVAQWAKDVLLKAEKNPGAAEDELRRLVEHLTTETPVPEQPYIARLP